MTTAGETWRSELRSMLRLALPLVFVQLGMMAMGTVDVIMLGHYSEDALAAASLGHLYSWALMVFGIGVLTALDPVVSQAIAARDTTAARRGVQRGIVIAVTMAVPLSMLGLPARTVLELLGQPDAVVPDAAAYVLYTLPGVLPFFVFGLFRQCLQAMSKTAPIVLTIVGANLLNLFLNWVLIFGNLGFPALGVRGSAIATSGCRWAMGLGLFGMAWPLLREYLTPWDRRSLAASGLWRMFRLGAPVGVQLLLEMGVFGATALLMGWIGKTELAGHQVALNLASISFMVPLGVSFATAVRVGYAVGRESMPGARRAAAISIVTGAGVMGVFGALFLLMPATLASWYFDLEAAGVDRGAFEVACALIPLAGVFQVFDGLQVVCVGILRGLGDTRTAMIVNLIGFWLVGLPCGYYLAFARGFGADGLWWGLVIGLGCVALTLLAQVVSRLRRHVARVRIDDVPPPG